MLGDIKTSEELKQRHEKRDNKYPSPQELTNIGTSYLDRRVRANTILLLKVERDLKSEQREGLEGKLGGGGDTDTPQLLPDDLWKLEKLKRQVPKNSPFAQ